jgi:DNA-directed RNA polymerase subunit M/transcription elongation factor TFIIS
MKVCEDCGFHLVHNTANDKLTFICYNCNKTFDSTPDDTLIMRITFGTEKSAIEKYNTLIEQSPHDDAGNKVAIKCDKCGIPYMTLTYIGQRSVAIYSCECGNIVDGATMYSRRADNALNKAKE